MGEGKIEPTSQIAVPDYLFRYRRSDTKYFWDELGECIRHRRVFLTSAANLNDPFDFRPAYEESPLRDIILFNKRFGSQSPSRNAMSSLRGKKVLRGEYRSITKSVKKPVDLARLELQLAKKIISELPLSGKLACFSEIGSSLLMWAHYAADHTGVCLRFDVDFDGFDPEQSLPPMKVNYVEQRPTITTLKLLHFASRTARDSVGEHNSVNTMEMMYLNKGLDWSYEREWRVFASEDVAPRYRMMHCLKPSAIIAGMKSSSNVLDRIVADYGKLIPIFRAAPSKHRYELEFLPVN